MTIKRWLPTFLAFPAGGLLAMRRSAPSTARVGGRRRARGRRGDRRRAVARAARTASARWAPYTAGAMAAGIALAAAVTGGGHRAPT